jgi:hypothetical protein
MKKSPSIITVLLVLPLLQVHSQNLEGNHTYRIGDKVEKQLVEYELNDESAKNVVWDLRDLSDLMITRTDPMIPKENGADGRLWKKK